ncbi:hypothetical protein CPB83DRAFT_947380 [Crepidotus variabilis]|uniref:NmrA-like domain-containing protein n=1 Tax=Crepidotus variabilis TaxID=179855 RepID=A0A9P6JKX7_9AGAR|nr:hypothetical protein CPB83DRAFT_947380 [Crepidotus variabilis]
MTSIRSILVLGAGELGASLLASIEKYASYLETKPIISVLLGPSSRTDEIAGLNISIIRHDLAKLDAMGLATVMQPYDAVVSCTGFGAGGGTQLKIAQAALAARVRRFIPWQFGVDYDAIGRGSGQDLFDEQLEVRELLRSQTGQRKTDWVIVSTGVFTSFLFEDAFGVVQGAITQARNPSWPITVTALGSWGNGLTVTSVEDIGRLTARVLLDPNVHNQVVYLSGDTISYDRLASVVQKVTGKEVRRALMTQEALEDKVLRNPTTINKYLVAFGRGRGVSWPLAGTYNAQAGIQTMNIETWLKRQLQARGIQV